MGRKSKKNRLQRVEDESNHLVHTIASAMTKKSTNKELGTTESQSDHKLPSDDSSYSVLQEDGRQSIQQHTSSSSNDDPNEKENIHRAEYIKIRHSLEDSLTPDDISHFIEKGYVVLKSAFSKKAAIEAKEFLWNRMALDGISKDNTDTWVRRHGIAETYWPSSKPWDQVITAKLYKAIDQLCGENNSKSFGCGWWVVSFPNQVEPPWGVEGNWHVDGYGYRHYVNSPEIGIMPIFIFNDLGPADGGTVLCPGSHRVVANLLWKARNGIEGSKLSNIAKQYVDIDNIVQVQGEAGDVVLIHPFMLHARGKNLGTKGVESVRFMCHPAVPLVSRMNLNQSESKHTCLDSSDGSTQIVKKMSGENKEPLNNNSQHSAHRSPVEEAVYVSQNEAVSLETCSTTAAQTDMLEMMMGFKGFKKRRKRNYDSE